MPLEFLRRGICCYCPPVSHDSDDFPCNVIFFAFFCFFQVGVTHEHIDFPAIPLGCPYYSVQHKSVPSGLSKDNIAFLQFPCLAYDDPVSVLDERKHAAALGSNQDCLSGIKESAALVKQIRIRNLQLFLRKAGSGNVAVVHFVRDIAV